jgi:hypothetical protein
MVEDTQGEPQDAPEAPGSATEAQGEAGEPEETSEAGPVVYHGPEGQRRRLEIPAAKIRVGDIYCHRPAWSSERRREVYDLQLVPSVGDLGYAVVLLGPDDVAPGGSEASIPFIRLITVERWDHPRPVREARPGAESDCLVGGSLAARPLLGLTRAFARLEAIDEPVEPGDGGAGAGATEGSTGGPQAQAKILAVAERRVKLHLREWLEPYAKSPASGARSATRKTRAQLKRERAAIDGMCEILHLFAPDDLTPTATFLRLHEQIGMEEAAEAEAWRESERQRFRARRRGAASQAEAPEPAQGEGD